MDQAIIYKLEQVIEKLEAVDTNQKSLMNQQALFEKQLVFLTLDSFSLDRFSNIGQGRNERGFSVSSKFHSSHVQKHHAKSVQS
jgi:hypothetical protein